jgi:hypothetical protein
MAKTKRRGSRINGSRRRRGGQMGSYGMTNPVASSNTGSDWFSSIGSGISNALSGAKKAVSGIIPQSSAPAMGGRRRRRGGSVDPYTPSKNVATTAATLKGGRRRMRRGGSVDPYTPSKNVAMNAGPVGGSRRRNRRR